MATKLFVGSLSYSVTDDDLRQLFSTVGQVVSAQVIIDRDNNRSKGFGFVEMSTDEEAQAAVRELNGKDLNGRSIVVNEARPREERPRNQGNYDRGSRGSGYNNNRY